MKPIWEEKKLGDILALEYGKPLPRADRAATGKYAVYGANGIKDRADQYYYDKPSIIVGRKGSAGEINLTEPSFWPLDVTYFVTFDAAKYDLQFLYHLLSLQDLPSLARGVKPGINRNEVYARVVKVPPLPEQQRVVAILDQAFAGLATATANAESNLKDARVLFDSYLNSIFSKKGGDWVTTTIREAVDRGFLFAPQDGNHGEIHPKKSDYVQSGVPFVMAADLQEGDVNCVDCKFISEKTATGLRKGFAKDGDVLLSHKGTIGRVAVLHTDRPFVVLTPQVTYYRVKNTDVLFNQFIRFAFESAAFQSEMARIAGAGSTRSYIGITKQCDLKISYPPLADQRRLTSALVAMKRKSYDLEKAYRKKVESISDLEQSILHMAFSGELTSPPTSAVKEAAE